MGKSILYRRKKKDKVLIGYVHWTQFASRQRLHIWKEQARYENLSLGEIHSSVDRANELN